MSKVLKIVGMALSAAIIVLGALCYAAYGLSTGYGPLSERPRYGGVDCRDYEAGYDTGYAEFGADYYTYSNNNAAETSISTKNIADNTYNLAENSYRIGTLICQVAGLIIIVVGALALFYFGIKFFDQLSEEKKIKNKAVAAPIQPVSYTPNVQYSPYSVPVTPPVDNYQQPNL